MLRGLQRHQRGLFLDAIRKRDNAFLSDYVERELARDAKIKQGLVRSMTRDDCDRLSFLTVLDSPQGKFTQPQRRDACVNLLTYPHYWVLTDVELSKKWERNHATINRWRKPARKLLRDDKEQISDDRKTEMNELIESRLRVLQPGDKNDKRQTRYLNGEEPPIDSIRDIWSNETYFTKWLGENIDVLNNAINLSLSIVERERKVGDLKIDLVAKDESGNLVIIENQLEQSDHNHLGQVITYLVAQEARGATAAIWIVTDPRPEHIAAISWLNESSSASFYLIKIEDSVPIRNSLPEPLLTVIVDPSGVRRKADKKKEPCQLEMSLPCHREGRLKSHI